jgi:hypothetical protein
VRRRVPEAFDLLGLCQQIRNGVVDEKHEAEITVNTGSRHVADDHVNRPGAGLCWQVRNHGRRQLDPGDRDAVFAQCSPDPPGSNCELKCSAVEADEVDEVDEKLDRRGDEFRIGHLAKLRVVALSDFRAPNVYCQLTIVTDQPVTTKHGLRDDLASGETRAQRLVDRTVSVL